MTNYHLFDFLEFPEDLNTNLRLWKSYRPTSIASVDGDIIITIPFQQQKLNADMAADTDVPQQSYKLILRQYNEKILRIFCDFKDPTPALPQGEPEGSSMLLFSDRIKKIPLSFVISEGDNLIVSEIQQLDITDDFCGQISIVTPDGTQRALLNLTEPKLDRWSDLQPDSQPTTDIRFFPDGKREIRLAAYDHFSPPRYDALPLALMTSSCHSTGKGDFKKDSLAESNPSHKTNINLSPTGGGDGGGPVVSACISFECKPNECFVGTGERFTKMDLSGRTFLLKNQDGQGVNNRRTYKNIPFYISSQMYGAFFHTCAHAKLDLANHSTRSVQFLAKESKVDCFLIGGDTIEEITRGYRDLTGYPSMPPLWSFGIWMSRMTYFSADEVQEICDRLRKEKYPCDVIHLDTGWFETDWLCEWKFNKERFPDPEGFIRGLLKQGFKTSLWQLPYVAEDAEQIDEARANDYIGPLTKKQESEGSNFSSLDYAGTIDFTYDKATEWYKGLLKNLLDMGVKCIKTDFGENIHMDAVYKNMTPEQLNNLYALLYQKAAYEITKEVTGDGIVWARAAWAGCQRYPLHWGGDSCSSWDGLAGSLKGGLHFGLSGFAFWSHDVPGFHTLPNFMNTVVDDKVYLRWTQFGVFSSHMRYHGTNKREPWHYPAIAPIVKAWWNLRYMLLPYIIRESEKAVKSGSTIVQALIFHHPEDKICWHIDDQYYFGDDILVAPVMNSESKRDIYLPEGEWIEFFTGQQFTGLKWLNNINVPLEIMPVFIRKGATIPIYPDLVDSTDNMDMSKVKQIKIGETFRGFKLRTS